MLIPKEQVEALEAAAAREFEDRVVDYVRDVADDDYQALGDAGTRELIRYGIERARTYDVEAKDDLCTYVGLMLAFGRDFDTDPELPWADEILNGVQSAPARMERLYEAAMDALDALIPGDADTASEEEPHGG